MGLAPFEIVLLRRAPEPDEPVCFIVGPPRSGTTLLYELLVRCFYFSYFSNLAHRFYRTPVAATRIGRRLIHSWEGTFVLKDPEREGRGYSEGAHLLDVMPTLLERLGLPRSGVRAGRLP